MNNLLERKFWKSFFYHAPDISFDKDILELYRDYNLTILSDDAYTFSISKEFKSIKVIPIWCPDLMFVFDENIPLNNIYKKLNEMNIKFVKYSDFSTNSTFLLRSNFYKDRENWRLLVNSKLSKLYILPTTVNK